MHVDGVAGGQAGEDRGAVGVRLLLPADGQETVGRVAEFVVHFAAHFLEERGNRGDHPVHRVFRRPEYPPKVTGLRKIRASQFAMARATSGPSSRMCTRRAF